MKTLLSLGLTGSLLFSQGLSAQDLEWAFPVNIGSANNFVRTVTHDQLDNVIIGGILQGSGDFDPGAGIATLTSNGPKDGYVAKYNENGVFSWAYTFGGADSEDLITDIITDADNNIYIGGFYTGTADFDPGAGVYELTSHPSGIGTNAYVLKLDANGNFLWAKDYKVGNIGGTDKILALALDRQNDLIVGGKYYAGNFAMSFEDGNSNAELNEGTGGHYVLKLDEDGNFIWVKRMLVHAIKSISIDDNDNIYVGGEYYGSNDMDPDVNEVVSETSYGQTDLFICKLDASGIYQWSEGMGSGLVDDAHKLVVDGNNYITLVGNLNGAFAKQYNGSGTVNWDFTLVSGTSAFTDVVADDNNNLIFSGFFTDPTDMNPGTGDSTVGDNNSYEELVLLKLTNQADFIYTLAYGIRSSNSALTVTSHGSIYLGGIFPSGDMDCDAGPGETLITSTGFRDLFLLKLHDDGAIGNGSGSGIAETLNNSIHVYPNPASDWIYVNSSSKINSLTIYDLSGKKIAEKANTNRLDISEINSGTYLMEVITKEGRKVTLFMKD